MNFQKYMEYRNETNAFVKAIGCRITDMKEGWARAELELTAMHRNVIGSTHGGVMFTIADTVGGAAASSRGKKTTTVSATINYLSPAMPDTEKLIGETKEIKVGKHIAVYDVFIRDEHGRLITSSTMTYYVLGDLEGFDK